MRALQKAFLDDLAGLGERAPSERAEVVTAPPLGSVEDRWHVYAHGYFARIEEALGDDFRAVRRIVGKDVFAALVDRYLKACPPRSYDLAHAGDRLAIFLERDAVTKALPFLPDLARLEWKMVEAFVAEDARPLSRQDLKQMDPARVAELRLRLHPSAALIRSKWPLCDLWALWKREDDDEVSVEVEGRPSAVLVYRHGFQVKSEALEEEAASLVESARAGVSLLEFWALSGSTLDGRSVRLWIESFTRLVEGGVFIRAERDLRNLKEEDE